MDGAAWVSSDMHTPDLWLASYGRNLLHTSQLMEVPGAHQVLLSRQMKSSLCHSVQVEAPDLSDSLSLNAGQWRGVQIDLEVCRSVRDQNPAQALQCSDGYFGSAPCKENSLYLFDYNFILMCKDMHSYMMVIHVMILNNSDSKQL